MQQLFNLICLSLALLIPNLSHADTLRDLRNGVQILNQLDQIMKRNQRNKRVPQRSNWGQNVESPSQKSRQEWQRIQARLNELGFDAGTVDGKPGSKTKNAIAAFQAANGLQVDGKFGPQTQSILFSEHAQTNSYSNNSPQITSDLTQRVSGDPSNHALQMIRDILQLSNTNGDAALAWVESNYAAELNYFGNRAALGAIIQDKRRYFDRWPVRSLRVNDDEIYAQCDLSSCLVNGVMEWNVQSVARNQQASGFAEFTYKIDSRTTKVIEEASRVIDATKFSQLKASIRQKAQSNSNFALNTVLRGGDMGINGSAVNPVLQMPDLSRQLGPNRILGDRVIAPVIFGGFLNYDRFGMVRHRSQRDEFFNFFRDHIQLEYSRSDFQEERDLPRQAGMLRRVLGQEVANRFIVGSRFIGNDEFEIDDNRTRLIATLDAYFSKNKTILPMKMAAVFPVALGEYDRKAGGFPIKIDMFSNWGKENLRLVFDGYFNSLSEKKFDRETVLPLGMSQAREVLGILRADALVKIPQNTRSEVRNNFANSRYAYGLGNYTIENISKDRKTGGVIVNVKVESIELYSTPDLTRKLVTLMEPGSNNSQTTVIDASPETIELSRNMNIPVHEGRLVAPLEYGNFKVIERFDAKLGGVIRGFDRLLLTLALKNRGELIQELHRHDQFVYYFGAEFWERYMKHRQFIGRDEFEKQATQQKFVQAVKAEIEPITIKFPLELSAIARVGIGKYDVGKQEFPLEISWRETRDFQGSRFEIQSTPLVNSLTGEKFSYKTRLPIDSGLAPALLETIRNDYQSEKGANSSFSFNDRIAYAKIDYRIMGVSRPTGKDNRSSNLLVVNVEVQKIDIYSTPNLTNKLVTLMENGAVAKPVKPEEDPTSPDSSASFEMLGVKLGQNLKNVERSLSERLGSNAKLYHRAEPAQLIDDALKFLAQPEIHENLTRINAKSLDAIKDIIKVMKSQYVALPLNGLVFQRPLEDSGKETISAYSFGETGSDEMMSFNRLIQFEKPTLNVDAFADRLKEKYGKPDYVSNIGKKNTKYYGLRFIWAQDGSTRDILGKNPRTCTVQLDEIFKTRGNNNGADDFITRTDSGEIDNNWVRAYYQIDNSINRDMSDNDPVSKIRKVYWYASNGERLDRPLSIVDLKHEAIENNCGQIIDVSVRGESVLMRMIDLNALQQLSEMEKNAVGKIKKAKEATETSNTSKLDL